MKRETKTITIDADVHAKAKSHAHKKGYKLAAMVERMIIQGIKK